MEVDWVEDSAAARTGETPVPAAKLHVLGLSPLKERLGPKWPRLSNLVHGMLKKTIERMQGPSDSFIKLDELSYAITFANLSVSEAHVICNNIAREVCELLFGEQIDEISCRNIVAAIVLPEKGGENYAARMEALIEKSGTETIITRSARQPSCTSSTRVPGTPLQAIQQAHESMTQKGLRLGLFPVWDLRKANCNCLLVTFHCTNSTADSRRGRKTYLSALNEADLAQIEIDLLKTAEAYGARIRSAGKVCAVSVGVSYRSLACLYARGAYLAALQACAFSSKTPLLLRLEGVPAGAPDGRVAEFVAMLAGKNRRILVEFESIARMPAIGVRLGAQGIGASIPPTLEGIIATTLAEKLVKLAAAQGAFAFLDQVDTSGALVLANLFDFRFGTGSALGHQCLSGLEEIPDFPLEPEEMRIIETPRAKPAPHAEAADCRS